MYDYERCDYKTFEVIYLNSKEETHTYIDLSSEVLVSSHSKMPIVWTKFWPKMFIHSMKNRYEEILQISLMWNSSRFFFDSDVGRMS